jgi:predicted O-methyltransferase YrrM
MKGVPLNEELYQYIVNTFAKEDDILKSIIRETEEKRFPMIQVSPENGKFLQLLIRMISAKRVLEVGTLTGYSAVWMARGLPEDGKLTTLEIEKGHAEVARKYIQKAGLEKKAEVVVGDALEQMNKLSGGKFDFVFIDADKERYPLYLEKALSITKKGGVICADNTLRDGDIVSKDPDKGTKGVQTFNKMMAADSRLFSILVPISDGVTVGLVK